MNSSAALIIAGIAALAAVAAAIVGPIVTLNVTKRQIMAATASAGRQKWIEAFRDNLAEMIAYLAIFKLNYESGNF